MRSTLLETNLAPVGAIERAGGTPRHAAPVELRVSPAVACLTALLLVVAGAALGAAYSGGGAVAAAPVRPAGGQSQGPSIMKSMAQSYSGAQSSIVLPPATAPPAPAPPSLIDSPSLRPHEIFGFAPYWALPEASGFNVAELTTLAYFSIDVNRNATLAENGSGWVGYQSQALADLVTRAHDAGDRVVLTITCVDQSALDALAADPTAGSSLGTALAPLVAAKNLDGVNIDFEGNGSKDQTGLDRLVAALSATLHQANPHWQVTMDTYASSAGDPAGFYDIAGLAPSVDAFFVMAYDMNNRAVPTPTAPLTGPGPGFTDVKALEEYTAVVPASKVILGVPYYGYDWPTAGPGLGDPATGPPTPLGYAQVASKGAKVYWDPATQTPWISYQVGPQWHQTWFDDPTSLALKAQLANAYHIAGVGIWAMGMDGGNPAMLAALRGNAPVVKNLPRGPAATPSTTTSTTPVSHTYRALWNGAEVALTPVDPSTLAGLPAQAVGQLGAFTTDDPTLACLETGPPLTVDALTGSPGVYAVAATTPADCASGAWEFDAAPTPTSPPEPTSTTTTTSTTEPSTPTSTTTTTTSTTTTTAPGH
jgi:spore germination protein YaaH